MAKRQLTPTEMLLDLRGRLATIPANLILRWQGTPTPSWDNFSRFVYNAKSYSEVLQLAALKAADKGLDSEAFTSYAVVRFFNYLPSRIVELQLLQHHGVTAEPAGNKFRDLRIDGQPFDVKLTFPPKRRKIEVLRNDLDDPRDLMKIFLQEQGWARFRPDPRLLVVLLDIDGGNQEKSRWRLKTQIDKLEKLVGYYMAIRRPRYFPVITFTNRGAEYETTTDIMFLVRENQSYAYVVYRWMENGIPQVIWHHHHEQLQMVEYRRLLETLGAITA